MRFATNPDGSRIAADRWYFEDPECRRSFLDAIRESVRQGREAFAWEAIDVFLPWGFRLADVAIEVHVHGEQDTWVERRHIDFLVETLPNARLTTWPDSGHGPSPHWGEILDALAIPGVRVVTATATDADGATANASITLTAVNNPPKVTIDPQPTIYQNVLTVLSGHADDLNQYGKLPCSSLGWTSASPSDTSFPATGCHPKVVFKGSATGTMIRKVTLTATDEYGKAATATKFFLVSPPPKPNSPPLVTILNPPAGAQLAPDKSVSLNASVIDPDSPSTKLTYKWTVTVSGQTKTIGTTKSMTWKART